MNKNMANRLEQAYSKGVELKGKVGTGISGGQMLVDNFGQVMFGTY